jgi:phosphatidylinositol alpha-mannosyltransferase
MSNSESLKIGFVLDDSLDKADGVQQYVLTVGAWLAAQGHDVHYLVGQTRRDDYANIHSLGKNVAVRFNHNRMSMPLPTSRSAIRELLQHEQFDVLHVQLPYSPWLAQRIIRAADSKTVIFGTFHVVPHTFAVRAASRLLAAWTRSSLKRFDQIVSVSTAAENFARKTFKLRTEVLPNVVDYARFAKAKALPQYADKLTVVFLGRLVPRKGCMLLLQAVSQLLQRPQGLPAFRVVICGMGPLEAKLKAYAKEHHLEATVEFTGFVAEEDKPHYLASADIAVFPSTGGESFGIVLIEAMAAGHAAVLAGDNVGYRSVLSEKTDLLFPPRSVEALASKLSNMLRDDGMREAAATWGKAHAKQFDVQVVGSQLADRYKEALRLRHNVR